MNPIATSKIGRWIIVITGFTQREGERTGLERLYYAIRKIHETATCECILKSWRDDTSDLADRIFNHSDDKPEITIIGYSWGGNNAIQLANELRERGRTVQSLVLIDAVARPRWFWKWWLSMTRALSIHVPENVKECWAWRQNSNRPRGHRVVRGKETTLNGPFTIPGVTHQHIDDQPEIHNKVLEILAA